MKPNEEKDKLHNSDQLYTKLLPIIESIDKKYQYFTIDRVTFEKLVEAAINQCQNNLSSDFNEFILEFTTKLTTFTNNYVKNILTDSKKFSLIMSNFIASEIRPSKSYKAAMNNFNKISEFFNNIEFVPTTNLVIELLKDNPLVEELLSMIVEVNIDTVKNNQLETIFEDNISIVLIEIYCMLHDIKINQDLDDEFYEKLKLNNYTKNQTIDSEFSSDIVRAYLIDIGKKSSFLQKKNKNLPIDVYKAIKEPKILLLNII